MFFFVLHLLVCILCACVLVCLCFGKLETGTRDRARFIVSSCFWATKVGASVSFGGAPTGESLGVPQIGSTPSGRNAPGPGWATSPYRKGTGKTRGNEACCFFGRHALVRACGGQAQVVVMNPTEAYGVL